MSVFDSLARQLAIGLQTGQASSAPTAEQLGFGKPGKTIRDFLGRDVEANIAEQIQHEQAKASDPLHQVGRVLKPLTQVGLSFILGTAARSALPLTRPKVPPMSLLGNGNGGFLPSGEFSNIVQTGIGLLASLRSNRSTSSASPVLPGAGLVRFTGGFGTPSGLPPLPGPVGGVQKAGEMIGQRVARGFRRRRRRINPLNARAARRAIRRIKAVRKITAQIERALPTRRVAARGFSSPGVITRREASRALRR